MFFNGVEMRPAFVNILSRELNIIFAVFALVVLGATSTAIAQQSTNNDISSIIDNPEITEQEALERSTGRVVLHYGSGITDFDVAINVRALEMMGVENLEAYPGSANDGKIDLYFYGNKISMAFDANNGGQLGAVVVGLLERYDLM